MNIFAVYQCPVKSAQALCDIHVNKMLQEQIQLLSVAHYELDGVQRGTKPTHKNHPSALFTRESKQNYLWVLEHAKALMQEYTYRTGKIHGYGKYLEQVLDLPRNIQDKGLTDFPMAMPNEFKKTLCVHTNYRLYLNAKLKEWHLRIDKRPIVAKWTKRNKPEWISLQ